MSETIISVNRDVQAKQRQAAGELRSALGLRGTLVVNILSSPGAGKTRLLEATCRHWGERWKSAVLVGDIATDRDAKRLEPWVPVRQLTTGGACHLDLTLVQRGLASLPDEQYDFLFIENVGNLVCPASHDLAEHLRVVLLSTTEGDDKPAKYPKMFRTSDLMIISKMDLLPHVPFSVSAATEDARQIRESIDVLPVCAINGEGVAAWCQYLEQRRSRLLQQGA